MAIYKRGREFELGTTEHKSSKWPERDSNPGPPDCESDALTTRPRMPPKETIFEQRFVSYPDYPTFFIKQRFKKRQKEPVFTETSISFKLFVVFVFIYLPHDYNLQKDAKNKCRKKWRGGLKETINLMLIRPHQLQFSLN